MHYQLQEDLETRLNRIRKTASSPDLQSPSDSQTSSLGQPFEDQLSAIKSMSDQALPTDQSRSTENMGEGGSDSPAKVGGSWLIIDTDINVFISVTLHPPLKEWIPHNSVLAVLKYSFQISYDGTQNNSFNEYQGAISPKLLVVN